MRLFRTRARDARANHPVTIEDQYADIKYFHCGEELGFPEPKSRLTHSLKELLSCSKFLHLKQNAWEGMNNPWRLSFHCTLHEHGWFWFRIYQQTRRDISKHWNIGEVLLGIGWAADEVVNDEACLVIEFLKWIENLTVDLLRSNFQSCTHFSGDIIRKTYEIICFLMCCNLVFHLYSNNVILYIQYALIKKNTRLEYDIK